MIHWTWLLLAWIIGPAVGWFLCCLCTASKYADDHIDRDPPIGI